MMAGFSLIAWAVVLLLMLPEQTFAYCDVSFPTSVTMNVGFQTSWVSGCPVSDYNVSSFNILCPEVETLSPFLLA